MGHAGRIEEGQTKLMLQVEETRLTKEISGRSSTINKQKLGWNKKNVNIDNAEDRCRIGFVKKSWPNSNRCRSREIPKGKPSQQHKSNSDDIRRMSKGKEK